MKHVVVLLLTAAIVAGCSGSDAARETANSGEAPESTLAETSGTEVEQSTSSADSALPVQFVQEFYAWYAPHALRGDVGPAWYRVTGHRPVLLAPDLLHAMEQDARAQAEAVDGIVGLDFDPFLASQDPCERYDVGGVARSDDRYRVDVHSVCAGQRSPTPDVVAEVVSTGDAWMFANFQYPSAHSDLRSTLKLLREGYE